MSAAKHTQGPWALESETRGSYGSDLIVTAGDGGTTVAHCAGGFAFPKDGDEAEGNARLITAAPDLLKALKSCDDAFAGWQVGGIPGRPEDILALISKVRAAIAKAEGSR